MTGDIAYKFSVPSAAPPAGDVGRLLVVEDDEIYADLVCMMAQRLGIRADKARGWPEAAAMIAQAIRAGRPYRLILMDLMMPGIDGIEATRLLRASGPQADELPVIALSGLSGTGEIDAFLAAGGQATVAKPIGLAHFSAILAQWLTLDDAGPSSARVEDAGLIGRYIERKLAVIVAIDAAIASGDASKACADAVQVMLHQIAGVAGFFGDKLLSNLAAACDAALLAAAPGEGIEVLVRYRDRIAHACR